MDMQSILDELGLSQRDLARRMATNPANVSRLVLHGLLPKHKPKAFTDRLLIALAQAGATVDHLARLNTVLLLKDMQRGSAATAHPHGKKAPSSCELDEAPLTATPEANPQSQPPEIDMLLENVSLTEQAKKHFGLIRSPFVDDVSTRDDVFASPATRLVRHALLDAALNHGFIALIGESGSGKTTLREDLEERIREEERPVILIKPYTLAMEPNDVKGKQMKSGQIAESIAHALAPSMTLKSSPEARFRQVHELLRDSCRAGSRHLLVIEEAHRMPLATLKHLKGWMELKDGLRRLLGVCLIGQPELAKTLGEQRPEIREVVQRCEKVWLPPLDQQLRDYVVHKLARVGVKAEEVFADDAFDALRARLVYVPREGRADDAISVCYPLAVNNRLARAMNAAAKAGWPKVDAQVVMSC